MTSRKARRARSSTPAQNALTPAPTFSTVPVGLRAPSALTPATVTLPFVGSAASADDFWRGLYDREWTRRDQLQAAVAIPLTFLTALAGALWYLFQQVFGASDTPPLVWAPLFIVASVIAALSFVAATVALIRSFVGYTYQSIPYPHALIAYRDGLRAHYGGSGHADTRHADEEFRAHLEACYINAAECNARCNTRRAAWIHRCNSAMAAALLGAALVALPVARTMRAYPQPPQQIQLVTSPSTPVPPMSDTTPNSTTPASPPSNQQPAAPPKPEPPQNVHVRSNDTSPRPQTNDTGRTPKR